MMINFTLWLTVCFGGKFRQKRTIALGTGSGSDAGVRGDNFAMEKLSAPLIQ
ncbi:conserved hypothetical protein [Escherichia coli]|nr:conserved hypothetical protein [Escherichia coli]